MHKIETASIALSASARILRPLVKLLLRYSITYAAFSEMSKKIFFEVAKSEFTIPGKKQTTSRISTITGLSRKEVARIEALPESAHDLDVSGINRAARVISGWARDSEFQSNDGEPADLPFEGDQKSFSSLVKRYSGDITPRTIADELRRVEAISTTRDGLTHLNTRAYVSSTSDQEKLTILGSDVSDLVKTIDNNLTGHPPYFQRKVSYNYIPYELVPDLKVDLARIAQSSLEVMDNILSEKSVSKITAKDSTNYARIGVGIYYFEGDQQ